MYVQGLSRKVVQENSLTKLFVVRFSDVYPDAPRSLMTVSEACQLILETGNLGENGEIYVFEDDAVEAIAEKSLARKTGARGLRAIMEDTMMDLMYQIPSDESIVKCTITKETVEDKKAKIEYHNA